MNKKQVKEEANKLYYTFLSRVAKAVKSKRKEKSITLRKLFDLSGVSTTVLSDLENKEYLPRLDIILRLMVSLNISTQELIGVDIPLNTLKDNSYDNLREILNKLALKRVEVEDIIKYIKFRESLNIKKLP